jgi:cell wall-associated NlpC family hydrolase
MRWLKTIVCFWMLLFCLTGISQAAEKVYRQGDKSPAIAAVQLQMRGMGYAVGNSDGFFSWRFAQAVKTYQRSQGLKADGVLDSLTYYRLMGKSFPQPPVNSPAQQDNPGSSQAESIIATAKRYIGVPYRFGGVDPKGFDCSGYVQFVFNQHERKLPRSADVQYKAGKFVLRSQLQPGDLVFFTTYEAGPSHNGIYMGTGQFIHASSSRGVMISKLDDTYWKPRYLGSRRVL